MSEKGKEENTLSNCELSANDAFALLDGVFVNGFNYHENSVVDILIKHKGKLTSEQKTEIIDKLKKNMTEFLRAIDKCGPPLRG